MAIPWDRWRGIRIGEARVPGRCDFDDPEAQPFEQGGDSGDDWQLVDAASSMLPDGSISVVDLVHRADGMEHVKHEEYINAPSFGGAKQGYVYCTGGSGLGYYWDDRKALSFQKVTVLSQWPAYLKGLGEHGTRMVQGLGAC